MLSILIPIYNYDVTQLVNDLLEQCKGLDTPTEIICYDDNSQPLYEAANAWMTNDSDVVYKVLPKNVGRSAIRNLLAKAASYPFLLYLDCDSGIISKDFIQQYLTHIAEDHLICGGRNYAPLPPENISHKLHWLYGSKRETRSLQYRQNNPIKYFHTNNFVIPISAFGSLSFDESIRSYGYEDLVLAEMATSNGLTIKHIDNPIQHMELHDDSEFLSKTQAAVKNLIKLNQKGLYFNSKLEKAAYWLGKLGLGGLYRWYYDKNRHHITSNLKSEHPSLRKLDMYKLNVYLEHK